MNQTHSLVHLVHQWSPSLRASTVGGVLRGWAAHCSCSRSGRPRARGSLRQGTGVQPGVEKKTLNKFSGLPLGVRAPSCQPDVAARQPWGATNPRCVSRGEVGAWGRRRGRRKAPHTAHTSAPLPSKICRRGWCGGIGRGAPRRGFTLMRGPWVRCSGAPRLLGATLARARAAPPLPPPAGNCPMPLRSTKYATCWRCEEWGVGWRAQGPGLCIAAYFGGECAVGAAGGASDRRDARREAPEARRRLALGNTGSLVEGCRRCSAGGGRHAAPGLATAAAAGGGGVARGLSPPAASAASVRAPAAGCFDWR